MIDGPAVLNLLPQHGSHLRLEKLEARALLRCSQPTSVGCHVHDFMSETLVIAEHLVDHLLRAADERGTAFDKVLDTLEDHRQPRAPRELLPLLEQRPEPLDCFL